MYSFLVVAPCAFFLPSGRYRVTAGDILKLNKDEADIVTSPTFQYLTHLQLVGNPELNGSADERDDRKSPAPSEKLADSRIIDSSDSIATDEETPQVFGDEPDSNSDKPPESGDANASDAPNTETTETNTNRTFRKRTAKSD